MQRNFRLVLTAVIAAGFSGFGAITLTVAPSGAATAPSCTTISTALVKSTLGGAPETASSSTSTNTFDGYKATVLSCTYSATVNITYSSPATVADYKLAMKTLQHATIVKSVMGIGTSAFSGTGTNSSSVYDATTKKYKTVTVTTNNLWVLVKGKTFFEISASGTTAAKETALAKKMVPLV